MENESQCISEELFTNIETKTSSASFKVFISTGNPTDVGLYYWYGYIVLQ